MENMIYAHYFPLTSQGNIYSITELNVTNDCTKLLVASLKREIICFEYIDSTTFLTPSTKEILFTYIPNGAEIISIDAFNKSKSGSDIVIGITIIKTDISKECYLNIYTGEDNVDFNIDNVSQNCLMIDLNFIPYQLYHTYSPKTADNSKHEIVWLLSGSDCRIHMFRESGENHNYKEVITENLFIEFSSLPSIVLWMDIVYFNSMQRRVTAFGCESGFVSVSLVDCKENKIINEWSMQFVNIISSVKLFSLEIDCKRLNETTKETLDLNLLVVNTTLPSVIFTNILKNGLSKRTVLQKSNFYNIQSTSCIADIDLDGENEILIGTYGQEMLIYKFNQNEFDWKFMELRKFGNPIYSIKYIDVTGDGVRELLLLTLKGVHILQHKPEKIESLLMERIKHIEEAKET